jgi:hypothetical protein
MSKELEHFKKSYAALTKSNVELSVELLKSHFLLVAKFSSDSCNFSESPWNTLDNETLVKFKTLSIFDKISKKLLPIVYPGLNFADGLNTIPIDKLFSPRKLNPQQLTEALDSVKEITEDILDETLNNRTGTEIILDFLKSCVNFLFTMVTFGQCQNFFKSSTYHLEVIKQTQQDFHSIFEKLSGEEKSAELDKPKFNIESGMSLI